MIQANPHAPSDHMAVMRLSLAPRGEAPGRGVVARMKSAPCRECGGPMVEYFSPVTGRVVASPPCDNCLVSDVVRETPRWQALPMLKATGLDDPPRVGVGQAFAPPPPAVQLTREAWLGVVSRYQAGDWGLLGRYEDGKPSDAEKFAPELAPVVVRNRVACDSTAGAVRARYTKVPGLDGPGAVVDVVTLKQVGGRSTYAMINDAMKPCFGLPI